MANIEKHGKSLSAEGKVFKETPKVKNFEDLSDYQGPALKEQSATKDKGPPELQENEKKSDAYEVVSDGNDNGHVFSTTENEGPKIVKVGHHKRHHGIKMHASDEGLDRFQGHHRSGLHIVSLDGDDTANENALDDKDTRLYGSIGFPVSSPVRQRPHLSPQERESYYPNDYIPPSVVSVSQDELNGPQQRDEGQTRDEIFPIFRKRDPFSFSQSSQLTQPEELMQPFRPVSPKSISVGDRPNMFLLPMYNRRGDSDPAVLPFTGQNALPMSQSQLDGTAMGYSSSPPRGSLNNGLLLQSALQVPLLQTQSVTPSFNLPLQSEGQFLFNNQQPDARSLYQLQTQPQVQIPQVPMTQLTQQQPLIIPVQMPMNPDMLSSANQPVMQPASRWVDEDGRQRSEVLDRQRDRQDDDSPQDDRGEEGENDEEGRLESSRYYERDEDSRREDEGDEENQPLDYPPERSYSRDDEEPTNEEGEEADEPEEESTEDATGRTYERNDPATDEEENPDSRSPDESDSDNEEDSPNRGSFTAHSNSQQFNPQAMQRFVAANRPFNFPKFPMAQNRIGAQSFSRYQLTSPFSALKEHILPKPPEPKPPPPSTLGDPNVSISQMSPAEAEFLENKATLEPNFAPPIASKDTIPGKSRRFRFGLGNVLIRLNGKPLEDSSQLRSKIINGQIIQGKGKLIKSKGPVRVKLSHTKDAKHLKIIDIIAPKQFHVYDTKSKIRRPSKALNGTNKTTTKEAPFIANRRLQKALTNMT